MQLLDDLTVLTRPWTYSTSQGSPTSSSLHLALLLERLEDHHPEEEPFQYGSILRLRTVLRPLLIENEVEADSRLKSKRSFRLAQRKDEEKGTVSQICSISS